AQVTWRSSHETFATVNANGMVTGVAPGKTVIKAVSGEVSAEFTIEVKQYIQRYIQVQYDRPDGNYAGWNLWVWGAGVKDDEIRFEKIEDGKAIANIAIAPGVTR